MKKILTLVVMSVFAFSLAACGGDDDKLIVWSFTDELESQGDVAYWEETYGTEFDGMEIEYVIIPTADYEGKVMSVLGSGGKGAPDVFTGELDMIMNFMEAGFYADLEQMMKDDEDINFNDTKDDFIDYIWESGKDENGTLRALSWQSTPGAIFFRADLAESVWPNWDSVVPNADAPATLDLDSDGTYKHIYDFMSYEKFNTIDQLSTTAQEVVDADQNIKLFPDHQAIRFFAGGAEEKSWVVDGKLNPERMYDQIKYLQIAKEFYGTDLETSYTANAGEWSPEWSGGMMGPVSPAGTDEEYEIMAYTLPTWGLFHVIKPNSRVVAEDGTVTDEGSYGEWKAASGPNSYFWGGTFLGVNADSDKKEAAYSFVKSLTLDEERMLERAEENGDIYSRISIMEELSAEYEGNPLLGGQNHYEYFIPAAKDVDVSIVTPYDRELNTILGNYIEDYQKGDKTLEETLEAFYSEVRTKFGSDFAPNTLPTAPRS